MRKYTSPKLIDEGNEVC